MPGLLKLNLNVLDTGKCCVTMLLGKSVWIKTLEFFMISDHEVMNCFTELVPAGSIDREMPYLFIYPGRPSQINDFKFL